MIFRTEQIIIFMLACLISIGCVLQHEALASEDIINGKGSTIAETLINDYKSFYARERWIRMGLGFGLGAISANTSIDNEIQNRYQEDIRNSNTDNFSETAKLFGEGKYLIPLSLLSASLKYFDSESPVGNWGVYSARAYLVGSPAMLLMKRVTGGSRPGETNHDSNWRPFNDSNGVSGHAFMGAVPFLTLAKMNGKNKFLKYIAYVASTAAAWSRLNDNDHYLSQAVLGWYMAFESVDSVFYADKRDKRVVIYPKTFQDGYGIMAEIRW